MTINFGYVPASSTLYIPFATYDSNGASVTITGLAVTDIEIYKNGSTTQRASDAGYALLDTDGIDFDGITGIHGFSIDLSDNTDSGFYSAGAQYIVVVSAITADSQTVNFIPAIFRIGPVEANVSQFGGTAGTFASGIPSVSLTTSAINSVADQVWDEATSGHVSSGSFGQAWNIIRAGTAQAGGNTSITLDASASAVDDFYNNARIFITAGTGVGQGRFISDYVGSTKVATVATWATNPSSDSVFVILPFGSIPGASAPTAGEVADAVWDEARTDHVSSGSFGQLGALCLRSATAQAGTASTITLDSSASATNDLYNYNQITIVSGTGAGQSRQITDYVGSSKVATVGVNWTTNPSSDSVFLITPLGVDAATVSAIADAVWDEARSGHATAGTFGEYVLADTVRISGDATSADNLESYTDGTTPMPVNVTQLSGDSTAADNAEAFFDGTGYAGTNNVIPSVTTVTGNVTGNVGGSVGSVTGNVGGNVTGSVGSLAAQAKADVNAEVVDALATDTYAEPGQGSPGATIALSAKIGYLYKAWRNKHTQTSSEYALYADDGTTKDQEAGVSDDGTTFTRNEIQTGA
jgi:hypothetical protein